MNHILQIRVLRIPILFLWLALCALGVSGTAIASATLSVSKTADTDDGTCNADCSLREAINAANANSNSTITFASSAFSSAKTISLSNALPALAANVTLTGPAAGVTVQGINKDFNIFTIHSGVTAGFDSITIREGFYGIANAGTVNITRSVLEANVTGLKNLGTSTITNSILSGNYTGIENASGFIAVSDSSVNSNRYGILNYSGTLNVAGTQLSGNASGIKNFAATTVTTSDLSGNYTGFENNNGSAALSTSILNSNSYGIVIYQGVLSVATSTLADNRSGGVYNLSGTINIARSTLSNNQYGVNSSGQGTITNCTLLGKYIGLNIGSGGNMSVVNATVVGNSAYGVYNDGTIHLKNTIVAGNSFKIGGSKAISDDGHNLLDYTSGAVGFDPRGLSDYGGPTKTIGLLAASPAVDAGDSNGAPTTDQRGLPRVRAVDIGAFELQDAPPFINDFAISTGKNTPYAFTAKEFDDNYNSAQQAPLVTIKVTSLPASGVLTLHGNAVAVNEEIARADINALVYTPEHDYDGSDFFGWAASNGTSYSKNSARVTVTVNPSEDIILYSDAGQLITFFASSMDVESGGTLHYSLYNAPDGATLNDSTGEFRWTPTLAQGGKTYTFAIIASDGIHNVQQNVTLHVR